MPNLTRRTLLAASAAAALIPTAALAQDPAPILRVGVGNPRSESSHAVMAMTIKTATGTRNLEMESWTRGEDTALVRFTSPARDAGNATLQDGRRTYVFNPRLNQVIQLPASAMSQSWMGSDFSYNDLAKSDELVDDYTHTLLQTQSAGGHTIYVIQSVPKRGKPIVWGSQVVYVRDDYVLMREEFYDQQGNLVRTMVTDNVRSIGGRPYPAQLTMSSEDTPGQWTRVITKSAEFDVDLPDYLFTRSNLQNPR